MSKRVLVINPVGHSRWDEADKVLYKRFLPPDFEVDVKSLSRGPVTVETAEAYNEVIPLVVEVGKRASVAYGAIVVNCFLDPGVEELRREVNTIVVGPGEASLTLAKLYGQPVYIVTVGAKKETLELVWNRVRSLGFTNIVVDVIGLPIGVEEIDRDRERVISLLVNAIRSISLKSKKAVVVLGCTGFGGFAEEVMKMTGIPVIDPVKATSLLVFSLLGLLTVTM